MGDGTRDGSRGLLLQLVLPLALLLLVLVGVRWYGLGFGPVHRVREPTAVLSPALQRELTAEVGEVHDGPDAESAALRLTSDLLYFGFRHRTDLRFEHARQANSIEYAELFASAFNQLAHDAQLTAHAQVVRSQPMSLMGFHPGHSVMQSHDWVVITDGSLRRYVDPMLHDAWLGADVSRNIEGAVDSSDPTKATVRARRGGTHRPERLRSNTPNVVPRAEPRRQQGAEAPRARTTAALKWMEKLGVPMP